MNTSSTPSAARAATAARAKVPGRVESANLFDPAGAGVFFFGVSSGVLVGMGSPFPCCFSSGQDRHTGGQLVEIAELASGGAVVQALHVLDEVADDRFGGRQVVCGTGRFRAVPAGDIEGPEARDRHVLLAA